MWSPKLWVNFVGSQDISEVSLILPPLPPAASAAVGASPELVSSMVFWAPLTATAKTVFHLSCQPGRKDSYQGDWICRPLYVIIKSFDSPICPGTLTDSSMIEAGSKKSGFSSVLSLLFFEGGCKKKKCILLPTWWSPMTTPKFHKTLFASLLPTIPQIWPHASTWAAERKIA